MTDEVHVDEELDEEVVVGEIVTGAPSDADLPDDPMAAIEVLQRELAAARAAEEARTDDVQRVAAEFENFRKRAARDQDEIVERASQRLIEALLPVLDSFDGAFAHEAQSPSEELLLSGVRNTYHQLTEILESEGLVPIAAEGEEFDPAVHEAVAGGGGDHLRIAAEMRRGYTLKGRVVRPSLVTVEPAGGEEEESEDE